MERGGKQEQQLREGRKGDRKERPAGKMQCAVEGCLLIAGRLVPHCEPPDGACPILVQTPKPSPSMHRRAGGLLIVEEVTGTFASAWHQPQERATLS